MEAKNRLVIIFYPNGQQRQFCTKDLGDSTITVADKIECNADSVNIVLIVDGKVEGESYVRMPYILQMF